MRRYAIQGRDDYRKYNQLCGSLRQLAHKIANLDPSDPFRRKHEDLILEKMFDLGILGTGGGGRGKLSDIEHKLTVSAFARRRLPVIMTRLRMADTVQAAVHMVEQGHVRVGTDVVTDPAYLVSRLVTFFGQVEDSLADSLQEYGGFRYLGRLFQDQAEHHEVSRQARRLRTRSSIDTLSWSFIAAAFTISQHFSAFCVCSTLHLCLQAPQNAGFYNHRAHV